MTCLAIRIKLALFHILIAKNPQVLPVIPTKYPKNQKTWMTWFFFYKDTKNNQIVFLSFL